ncbi:tyrosine-protein phosphatase [Dactylosporangium sp. CS-047395]|uniref:tyrosine-protein phosphatase n=1 Tax=Dactylosporangium sp. CS-047395 TaxID=3239936 RepID=UPI003D93ECCD
MTITRRAALALTAALLAGAAVATPAQAAPAATWERSLGLANATNFRDVGGYTTADGHTVRTGVVFRSNKLSNLTAAEWQVVTAHGINRDVDLRNIQERGDEPDHAPAGVAYQVADVASLSHGIRFHDNAGVTLLAAIAAGLLSGSSDLGQSIGYPFMVNFVGADYAFRDTLKAIATNTSGGVVYHCSAGKDRTGWATAVLLTLLGVPMATVEADFLLSNTYLGRADAVQVAWLRAAFAELYHIYGTFTAYLHSGLMLTDADIAAIKARLLV